MRQIVLDTETTGMNKQEGGAVELGHNIIEIGAVEIVDRSFTGRQFHYYIKPNREVSPEAYKVHGLSDAFLADKPSFDEIADEFVDFIKGADLIIHNASFDLAFLNQELRNLDPNTPRINTFCNIIDTLKLAKEAFPGRRHSLDALCSHLGINNSKRELHGALLDAQILAEVYLALTGGQMSLFDDFDNSDTDNNAVVEEKIITKIDAKGLKVITASKEELEQHQQFLQKIAKQAKKVLWQ